MPGSIIQTGFTAGEISPSVYGKVDLQAYRLGAATMRNLFVDYRSGAASRPGTAFIMPPNGSQPRLFPFKYSVDEAYVIVIGGRKAQFIYNGAPVVESQLSISAVTNAALGAFTVTSHGYSSGDLVYASGATGLVRSNGNNGINGRFFYVGVVDANTLNLFDPFQPQQSSGINTSTWTAYVSGGFLARVYSVAVPYADADLRAIKYCQSGDVMTLTHPSYAAAELTRLGPTDWTYTPITFASSLSAPQGAVAYSKGDGGHDWHYLYCYQVTAFNDANKEESTGSVFPTCLNETLGTLDSTSKIPSNLIEWDAVTGATRYNIYKCVPAAQTQHAPDIYPQPNYVMGYIGQSKTLSFSDTNIAPDFTSSPPIHYNPFSASGAGSITITTPDPSAAPPALLGLLDPQITVNGTYTTAPQFAFQLSTDGWGNPVGVGSSLRIIDPGDGLVDPVSVTITEGEPSGSGMTCGFALALVEDTTTSKWQPSNACLASAFSGGSGYHPLLNSQMCPGNSALAYEGAAAVASSYYDSGRKAGTGYLMGGAATVRFTVAGTAYSFSGFIQLLGGAAAGMSCYSFTPVAGAAPTSYTWSITYDDMVGNIVEVSGSVSSGVQGATTTTTTPYASYTAPSDGLGPVPYVVGSTTYPFAVSNFSNPEAVQASVTISSSTNYPSVCFYFQGRRGFAASANEPQAMWFSRPNLPSNMDYSTPAQADDALSITLTAQDLSTIQSATPTPFGLLMLTADGAWTVTGGGPYQPITPSTINAQQQTFSGAAALQPVAIGNEVFYVQARGYSVKRLTYSIYVSAYVPTDVSVLSSHLFEGRTIPEWAWAEQPNYLIWAIRDDGIALSFTYLADQEIQGWARHDTQGYFRSVTVIPSNHVGTA